MGQFLKVADVATQLQVSRVTVRQWIRSEGLPAIQVSRAFRIDPEDLKNWLEQRKKQQGQASQGEEAQITE